MAITRVLRTFKGESGDATSEVHKYQVQTNDASATTCAQARVANDGSTAIPAEHSVLAGTTWTAKVRADRMDGQPNFFDVTVTYSAPDTSGGGAITEPKPEDGGIWNLSVRGSGANYEEEIFQDLDGVEIANSALQRFDNGVMKPIQAEEIIIEFTADPATFIALKIQMDLIRGYINESTVTFTVRGVTQEFPPGVLLLYQTDWSLNFDQAASIDTPDVNVRYTLHHRPDGWQTRKVDEGYYTYQTNEETFEAEWVPIRDEDGDPIAKPAFLNGEGSRLPAGDDIVLLEFRTADEADFSPLFEAMT